jgi:hypothetical protein
MGDFIKTIQKKKKKNLKFENKKSAVFPPFCVAIKFLALVIVIAKKGS